MIISALPDGDLFAGTKTIPSGEKYLTSFAGVAFVTSLINNVSMFDEGSGSGAYLWLLMGSVPIGLSLVVIGAIVALFKRFKS